MRFKVIEVVLIILANYPVQTLFYVPYFDLRGFKLQRALLRFNVAGVSYLEH